MIRNCVPWVQPSAY